MSKVVGVIGGMGPAATIHFMTRVMALTPAVVDQDHVRLIVDNNGAVFDRNAAIRGQGSSPAPVLAGMARGLERAGAELLVMPCNTAHAFAGDIRGAVALPFIDLIETACDEAMASRPARVGVLAADGCVEAGLYQRAFTRRGVDVLLLPPAAQARFMALVYAIKGGDLGPAVQDEIERLAGDLVEAGAQSVVAGCTEAPLVLGPADIAVPLIDSVDALARATIAAARDPS